MLDVTRKLVELLSVAPVGDDHFQGNSEDLGFPRVFGGQVLGQALFAACQTIDQRQPHSLHAYFLRPGDHDLPIDYEVQRVRDGGSFSVRRVIARQQGREILTASMSFQVEEDGFEHQVEMPDVPEPESLASEGELAKELARHVPERHHKSLLRDRPIEIRHVAPNNPLSPEKRPPFSNSWFKAQGSLPDDPAIHCCLLAYSSDFGLVGTALNPHGESFMSRGMQVASLDHAIWFHRGFRMDEWLLYAKDSPSASGGRGFNRGNFFDRQGRLVASTAQEGLIRKRG